MEAMDEVLDCVELETGPNPATSVLWMHGLGADGYDFPPIVKSLDLPPVPIRFVFPHAPMRPVTINGGYVMRAWYDILSQEFGGREDEAGLRASQKLVETLLAREVERGTPAERVVLAGFSQGGAISLHTGLRHSQRLAGLIVLSAYLPISHTLAEEANPANRGLPILMAHGTDDPIVPIDHARRSSEMLSALEYAVEWREYPMPHSVSPEEVDHISRWLRQILG